MDSYGIRDLEALLRRVVVNAEFEAKTDVVRFPDLPEVGYPALIVENESGAEAMLEVLGGTYLQGEPGEFLPVQHPWDWEVEVVGGETVIFFNEYYYDERGTASNSLQNKRMLA